MGREMVMIKCHMCGEAYDIPPYRPMVMETISKPGACLTVQSGKLPDAIQAQISHNLKCPNRPGGTSFWNWFKWRVRKILKRMIVWTE
jgi:hypothetical protein